MDIACPPAFLINLRRRPDRLAQFDRQAARLGIPYRRVEAVDGHTLDLAPYGPQPEFGRPGSVGCMLSHRLCWQTILRERLPRAIVFEDDAVLQEDFLPRLATVLAEARGLGEFDLLFLGTILFEYRHRMLTANIARCEKSFGTHGYLVTAAGARKLLEVIRVGWWPADNQIADNDAVIKYAVIPTLVNPGEFGSDINLPVEGPPVPEGL